MYSTPRETVERVVGDAGGEVVDVELIYEPSAWHCFRYTAVRDGRSVRQVTNPEGLRSSRHLVTGGAGFIGSRLANRLAADGHEVTAFNRFSRGKHARLDDSVQVVEGDIRNYPDLLAADVSRPSGTSRTCRARRRSTPSRRT